MQATGWPSVVAVVGKWFPRGRRGLIMGIWNSHTSVGNILGMRPTGFHCTHGCHGPPNPSPLNAIPVEAGAVQLIRSPR
jgi:MFS family permease